VMRLVWVSIFVAALSVRGELVEISADNADIQQKFFQELNVFEANTKDKDESFHTYTDLLRGSLTSRLEMIDRETIATKAALVNQEKALHMLTLQLGLVQQSTETVNIEDVLSGAANTLVECAHAQRMHESVTTGTQQLKRYTAATIAFADSLKSAPTTSSQQAACYETVSNVIRSIDAITDLMIHTEVASFNTTEQLCLSGQKRLVTESGWISADQIPVLEDVLAMRNELQTLSDLTAELRVRLTTLAKERDLKTRRLAQLAKEEAEHTFMVKQQLETMSRLRALMKGVEM